MKMEKRTFLDANGKLTKRVYDKNGNLGASEALFTLKDGVRKPPVVETKLSSTNKKEVSKGLIQEDKPKTTLDPKKTDEVPLARSSAEAASVASAKESKGWSTGKKVAVYGGTGILSLLLLGYLMNNMNNDEKKSKEDLTSSDATTGMTSSDPLAMDSSSSIPPFASNPAMGAPMVMGTTPNLPSSPMVF